MQEYILVISEERLKRIKYLEKELSRMYTENHELHEKRRQNKELLHFLENIVVRAVVLIEDVEDLRDRLVEATTSKRHDS